MKIVKPTHGSSLKQNFDCSVRDLSGKVIEKQWKASYGLSLIFLIKYFIDKTIPKKIYVTRNEQYFNFKFPSMASISFFKKNVKNVKVDL